MRWPWSPAPGKRRVSHGELIGLLRGALRAAELEAELVATGRDSALLEASGRAHELLQGRCHVLSDDACRAVSADVLASLPLTEDGRLHEAAFVALLESRVWERREREVVAVMASGQFDTDGGDAR